MLVLTAILLVLCMLSQTVRTVLKYTAAIFLVLSVFAGGITAAGSVAGIKGTDEDIDLKAFLIEKGHWKGPIE